MKRAISAVAVVSVIGTITSALLYQSASAAGATKTITFTSVQTASHSIDKTHFVGTDKVKINGSLVGFDTTSCVQTSTGKSAKCDVAASFKGGILDGSFTLQYSDGSLAGKVTGGTRSYTGATGTITGTSTGKNTEKVTVSYHT